MSAIRLSTCVKRLREKSGLTTADFGDALGVSHTAIVEWEGGKGISAFNRMRLLAYAERVDADAEVISALKAAQPELRP
jgi:transcriptional regulator with XRE-family HTH domain